MVCYHLCCFFILLHYILGQPQVNLYYTDFVNQNIDIFDHDCLRLFSINLVNSGNIQMMSFCLSENLSVFDVDDDKEMSKYTFSQLFKKNITAEQLYFWSASIDTVEHFQDYLNTKNTSLAKETFYNCTSGRFGHRCQYQLLIDTDQKLSLYDNLFTFAATYKYVPTTMTCYEHLKCDRGSSSVCLDWTEICNGQIDCLNDGVDEKDCWQLELKQCQENENLCSHGYCLPISLYKIGSIDLICPKKGSTGVIPSTPSSHCWMNYNILNQCNDMICSIYSFLTSSCEQTRDIQLLTAMYLNEDISVSKNCLLALASILNSFSYDKFCEKDQCIQIVQHTCPETFLYPQVPILFGNIYFGYRKKNFVSATVTRYICYRTTDYDDFFLYTQKFLFNNTKCICMEDFYLLINQSYYPPVKDIEVIGNLHKTLKRYHLNMKYITEICNRSTMYQCINSTKCVHISRVLDGIDDCPKMDDENLTLIDQTTIIELIEKTRFKCRSSNIYIPMHYIKDGTCDCGRFIENNFCEDEEFEEEYVKTNILFQHLCDRFEELSPILIDGYNHTDETECEQWEYNNMYTHCNGEWNCLHAEDEADCPSYVSFKCSSNSHRCVSPQTYQLMCLSIEKINDGSIDCLSATDEEMIRNPSKSSVYDNEYSEFYCINQSSYSFIPVYTLCDGKKDCQHGDDERFCTTNRTDPNYGICLGYYNIFPSDVEYFLCFYKIISRIIKAIQVKFPTSISNITTTEPMLKSNSFSIQPSLKFQHQCHLGFPVRVWLNQRNRTSISTCLCPVNYYGSQCQYQNQRVVLTLRLQTFSESSRILFIIIVSLIDDSDERLIHSYESFTYLSVRDCQKNVLLTLHYSTRPKNATRQYFIRANVYEQMTLYHRGSFLFSIEFPFLPIHRLGFLIDIPFNKTDSVICKNTECQHGRCMKYWNHLEDPGYCQCDEGWRGKYCHIPYRCECSPNAVCFDILSNNRSICLCPKNRFGTRCLISSTICSKNDNSTCLNGGECIVTEDYARTNQTFTCLCRQGYSGDRCEISDTKLILSFVKEITLSPSIFIHYVYQISRESALKRLTTFKTIPLRQNSLTVYWFQPYSDGITLIELLNRHYYLGVDIHETKLYGSTYDKTIRSSDRCPNITELFNQTFLQWHLIRRIKYYHLPCQNQSANLSCFHDEGHVCLCYNFYGKRLANCYRFEHNQTYNCFGRSECEHDSQCVQDDQTCPKQSMCICQDCYYGRKCQLRIDQFGLSLDAILGYHIVPTKDFSLQPLIVKISLALTIIFMVIGLINSILSLITFANKSICEVGCGLYLLGTSITTILIIVIFGLKFLFVLLTHMTIITDKLFLRIQCYSIDFLLRVCLCSEQWLTACVACERAVIAIQGVRFVKTTSRKTAKRVIAILIIGIMLTFVHDPLSRDLSSENEDDDNNGSQRTWCIVRYRSGPAVYNYIIQTFHFIGPFLVNLISSIALILKKTHQAAAITVNRSHKLILQEQLKEHKHLLIAPFVLVILAIPRLILIYTSKCMKSANDVVWLYLLGYFIPFIPSMLTFFIFILPSKFYEKEFHKTVAQYRQNIRRRLRLVS